MMRMLVVKWSLDAVLEWNERLNGIYQFLNTQGMHFFWTIQAGMHCVHHASFVPLGIFGSINNRKFNCGLKNCRCMITNRTQRKVWRVWTDSAILSCSSELIEVKWRVHCQFMVTHPGVLSLTGMYRAVPAITFTETIAFIGRKQSKMPITGKTAKTLHQSRPHSCQALSVESNFSSTNFWTMKFRTTEITPFYSICQRCICQIYLDPRVIMTARLNQSPNDITVDFKRVKPVGDAKYQIIADMAKRLTLFKPEDQYGKLFNYVRLFPHRDLTQPNLQIRSKQSVRGLYGWRLNMIARAWWVVSTSSNLCLLDSGGDAWTSDLSLTYRHKSWWDQRCNSSFRVYTDLTKSVRFHLNPKSRINDLIE